MLRLVKIIVILACVLHSYDAFEAGFTVVIVACARERADEDDE